MPKKVAPFLIFYKNTTVLLVIKGIQLKFKQEYFSYILWLCAQAVVVETYLGLGIVDCTRPLATLIPADLEEITYTELMNLFYLCSK